MIDVTEQNPCMQLSRMDSHLHKKVKNMITIWGYFQEDDERTCIVNCILMEVVNVRKTYVPTRQNKEREMYSQDVEMKSVKKRNNWG